MRCRAIGTWQSAGINCSACEGTRKQRWLVGCSMCGQQKGKRSFHAVHEGCNKGHSWCCKCCQMEVCLKMFFQHKNIDTWKVSLSPYGHKMSQTLRERRYVSRKSRIFLGGGSPNSPRNVSSRSTTSFSLAAWWLVATGHLQQKICRILHSTTTSKEAQFQHWKPSKTILFASSFAWPPPESLYIVGIGTSRINYQMTTETISEKMDYHDYP